MAHEQDEDSRREFLVKAGLISAAVVAGGSAMIAQSGSAGAATQSTPGQMMLTIFLRHDETKTLDEINAHLDSTGFHKNFPPAGVEVVSWYVLMGLGRSSHCDSLRNACARSIYK